MDNNGLFFSSPFVDVFKAESERKTKIVLHRKGSIFFSKDIFHLDVDFRAVKRRLVFCFNKRLLHFGQHMAQCFFSTLPVLWGVEVFSFIFSISQGQTEPIIFFFLKPQYGSHIIYKFQDLSYCFVRAFSGAEDMRISEAKAPYAHETGEFAGFFISVKLCHLSYFERKLPITPRPAFIEHE